MMQQDRSQTFSKTIRLPASPSRVWESITNRLSMAQWMSDSEIYIITDWKVGSSIITKALSKQDNAASVNKGVILAFEPEKKLQYSHFSPLSKLPDHTSSYTIFTFTLIPDGDHTKLAFTASNFPTEAIYKHMAFYWEVTLEILRKFLAA